jgi:hypothetical protein
LTGSKNEAKAVMNEKGVPHPDNTPFQELVLVRQKISKSLVVWWKRIWNIPYQEMQVF